MFHGLELGQQRQPTFQQIESNLSELSFSPLTTLAQGTYKDGRTAISFGVVEEGDDYEGEMK